MKNILPRLWEWEWFSEEKQLNFNGHLLDVGEHRILVDPPPMSDSDLSFVRQGGKVDYIIITNRDHERESAYFRTELQCTVFAPELDAPEMTGPIDKTFTDGELLPGGIWVIQLSDQKSHGESALFLQQGKGILIVGDAVIGHPSGSLRLLPSEKYQDVGKAKEGLRRLLKYDFHSLIVGDGSSIMTDAKPLFETVLSESVS